MTRLSALVANENHDEIYLNSKVLPYPYALYLVIITVFNIEHMTVFKIEHSYRYRYYYSSSLCHYDYCKKCLTNITMTKAEMYSGANVWVVTI